MKQVICGVWALCLVGLLVGCGDGTNLDCSAMCDKIKSCNSTTNLEECKTECAQSSGLLNDSLIDEVNRCVGLSCNELQTCISQSVTKCDTGLDDYFTKLCTKWVSCVPNLTQAACKTQLAGMQGMDLVKCLSDKALDAVAACVDKAQCSTLEAQTNQCVEDELGVLPDTGSSTNSPIDDSNP